MLTQHRREGSASVDCVLKFGGITQIILSRFSAWRERYALAIARANAERRWIGGKLTTCYAYSLVTQLVLHTAMFEAACTTYCAYLTDVLKFAELHFFLRLKVGLRATGPALWYFDKNADTGRSGADEFY